MHARGMGRDSAEDLDSLEELGDDAIIAQQSGAHELRPSTQVKSEPRTIVVSDYGHSVEPPVAHTPGRSSRAEATVVIRDRRKLDQMRQRISRTRRRGSTLGPFYLWGGVGAAAFILGGLAAFFASGSTSQAAEANKLPLVSAIAVPETSRAKSERTREPVPAKPNAEPTKAAAAEVLDLDAPANQDATPEVRLDELPVEKSPSKSR
jgi:hypothetical protein